MSNVYLNWAWNQVAASDLERADALILLYIADMANKAGEAFPSVGFIAQRTNLDPTSVRRSIVLRLVPKGLLERTRRGKSWLYKLSAPLNGVDRTSGTTPDEKHHTSGATPDDMSGTTPDDPVDKSPQHRAPRPTRGGEHRAPRPRTSGTTPATSGTTPDKPLLNPHLNHSAPDGAAETAVAASATSPRDLLFSDGVEIVRGLLGVMDGSARNFLGKLLTVAKDDCALVLAKLREAEASQTAGVLMLDARGWLMRACRPFRHAGIALLVEEGSSVKANELEAMWERLNGRAIGHA